MNILEYILIFVLLMLSAFFSGTETAFSGVNKIRLKQMSESNINAARALKIAENFDAALTTILVGNNIVNILSASLGTVICTKLFGAGGVGIATFVMTVLVLIFGEILPKSFAKEHAESFSVKAALPLSVLMTVLKPVTALFILLKNAVSKEKNIEPTMTEDELKYFINAIEEEGVLEENESELVRSALELDEKPVSEIIVPRVNIAAVEKDSSVDEVRELFFSEKYSRLPVYDRNIDSIIGFIHEKDFFRLDSEQGIKDIIREIMYEPEFTKCSELLEKMQKRKIHICVVLDQFGGTEGIVTMEDLIEELLGEIYDEADENDDSVEKVSSVEYNISADTEIEPFFESVGLPVPDSENNTMGGYATEHLGHIPKAGETVEADGLIITVTEAEETRILEMNVKLKAAEENTSDDKK